MPEVNQPTAQKIRWPWWVGGVVLAAVMGALACHVGRICCVDKGAKGEKAGTSGVG